jgi:hexokinase
MYLGEITRNILVALIDAAPKPLLFSGKATSILNKHYGLDTSVMSEVEGAWEGNDDTGIGQDYGVPAFGTFDADKLPAGLRARLECIRIVVAKQLGFKDVEVSLRDAAVCRPEFRQFVHRVYHVYRLFVGHALWLLGARRC